MEFEKFADEFAAHMTAQFKNLEVRRTDVDKLQGQSYHGLVFRDPEGPVGVTVNLDSYFRKLEEGQSMTEVLAAACTDVLNMELTPPLPDPEILQDYGAMKQYLIPQLVPVRGNEKMLGKVPCRVFMDLAVVCRFLLPGKENGEASILVTKENMKAFGIGEETVIPDAAEYGEANHPLVVRDIAEVLFGSGVSEEDGGNTLWVVSNDCGRYGASAITYPGALDRIGEKVGTDYYLIPSSIHEMLAVPEGGEMNAEKLDLMVRTVNQTEVSEEERLTDHSYHYDRKLKLLEYADEYEARRAAMEEEEAAHPADILSGAFSGG